MTNHNQHKRNQRAGKWILAGVISAVMVLNLIPNCALGVAETKHETVQWQDSALSKRGERSIVLMSETGVQRLTVTALTSEGVYTGSPVYPEFRFTDEAGNAVSLSQDVDYMVLVIAGTVGDGSDTEVGTYDWLLLPMDDTKYEFVGADGLDATGSFTIKAKPVQKTTVNFIAENLIAYTDEEGVTATATIRADGVDLKEGTDFQVQYYPYNEQTGQYDPVPGPTNQYNRYRVEIKFIGDAVAAYEMGTVNGSAGPVVFEIRQTQYTITYEYRNDVSGFEGAQEPVVKKINKGDTLGEFPPDPVAPPGQEWTGWYTMAGSTEIQVYTYTTVNRDMVIYAKWGNSSNNLLKSLEITANGTVESFTNSDYTTPCAFAPEQGEYYLRVNHDTERVVIRASAQEDSATMQLRVGSTTITPTATGEWTVPLEQATASTPANAVLLTVRAPNGVNKIYTIRVQRLRNVEFELDYGNSPAGRIQRESGITDRPGTLRVLQETRMFGGVRYQAAAWQSCDGYDGDLDDKALFVGQRQNVKDAAVSLVNSEGKTVSLNNITRELEVLAFSGGVPTPEAIASAEKITLSGNASEPIRFTRMVVPGVYQIVYSYTDPNVGEVKAYRPCIVTGTVGDVDLNGTVNASDITAIEEHIYEINTASSVYRFRVADVYSDENEVVNIADSALMERISDFNSLTVYYPAIS